MDQKSLDKGYVLYVHDKSRWVQRVRYGPESKLEILQEALLIEAAEQIPAKVVHETINPATQKLQERDIYLSPKFHDAGEEKKPGRRDGGYAYGQTHGRQLARYESRNPLSNTNISLVVTEARKQPTLTDMVFRAAGALLLAAFIAATVAGVANLTISRLVRSLDRNSSTFLSVVVFVLMFVITALSLLVIMFPSSSFMKSASGALDRYYLRPEDDEEEKNPIGVIDTVSSWLTGGKKSGTQDNIPSPEPTERDSTDDVQAAAPQGDERMFTAKKLMAKVLHRGVSRIEASNIPFDAHAKRWLALVITGAASSMSSLLGFESHHERALLEDMLTLIYSDKNDIKEFLSDLKRHAAEFAYIGTVSSGVTTLGALAKNDEGTAAAALKKSLDAWINPAAPAQDIPPTILVAARLGGPGTESLMAAHGGKPADMRQQGQEAYAFPNAKAALTAATALRRTAAGAAIGLASVYTPDGGAAVAEQEAELAARLADYARPGEILTTQSVQLLAARAGFVFVDRGVVADPALTEPLRIFAL